MFFMNKFFSNLRIFPLKQEDKIGKQERLNELKLKRQLLAVGIAIEFDEIKRHGIRNIKN